MAAIIRQASNQILRYVEYDADGLLRADDGTLLSVGTQASAARTPTVYNLAMASSGVEYRQCLPSGSRAFLVRARNNHNLRLAFVAGETANNYITVPGGASYADVGLVADGVCLYLMFTAAWPLSSEIAEIVVWV